MFSLQIEKNIIMNILDDVPTDNELQCWSCDSSDVDETVDRFTTVMIKNIPCRYNQSDLISEILASGFNINLAYVPVGRSGHGCRAYGFVNFETVEEAADFMQTWQHHEFKNQVDTSKKAHLQVAELQGFDQNLQHFSKNSPSKGSPWIKYW